MHTEREVADGRVALLYILALEFGSAGVFGAGTWVRVPGY